MELLFWLTKYLLAMRTIFFFLLLFPIIAVAQKPNKKLQKQIEELIKNHEGDVGIYVKSLKTGKYVAINADTVFPTASIVKVPILIGIMDKINKGELTYTQQFTYNDSVKYKGDEGLMATTKDSTPIEVSHIMMLMLTLSDNTASLWLQAIAGTGTTINKKMDELGFSNTKVNSRTVGREEIRNKYGWGQTTPKEMATIFEQLYQGKIINDSASKKMIRLLGRNFWDEEALSVIPSTTFVASKNGAVDASRNEILLVMAKEPYILSIFTKNNKDKSWGSNNAAWVLTRKISKLLFDYYN
jgi:beta-lactamase class A